MKKYKLYVCMPIAKFYVTVEAHSVAIRNKRLDFLDLRCNLLASYPSTYTIIEKVIES